MNDDKAIVAMADGSKREISIIISFNYAKNNKNYIVYKVDGSDNSFVSSFHIDNDVMILDETSEDESVEIYALLKKIISGGIS